MDILLSKLTTPNRKTSWSLAKWKADEAEEDHNDQSITGVRNADIRSSPCNAGLREVEDSCLPEKNEEGVMILFDEETTEEELVVSKRNELLKAVAEHITIFFFNIVFSNTHTLKWPKVTTRTKVTPVTQRHGHGQTRAAVRATTSTKHDTHLGTAEVPSWSCPPA